MASVLGKRTRCASTSTYGTRSKRLAQELDVQVHNDENKAPLNNTVQDQSSGAAAQKLATVSISTPIKTRTTGRPAKHGTPNSRIGVSPNTINAHFSVTKASVERAEKNEKDILSTPQTPRHRDALSKKAPATPRHRIQVTVTGTPRTPRTPSTPSTPSYGITSPYIQARQLFSSCCESTTLIGRDDERQEVAQFIDSCSERNNGGCLYISGPPGTGKSALIGEILRNHQDSTTPISVVNCMSVKSAADLAQKLIVDLSLTPSGRKAADFEHLKTCFIGGKVAQRYVVVLDEVDRLVDLDIKLLYNLFEWSMQDGSQLVLIGIANALDLTDRLLPRLKSRSIKPTLLPFMPYTAIQIAEIVSTKLKSLNDPLAPQDYVPFLHPAAIQFCAKKVAASTGDLRKVFDICKRAIDLAEQEAKAAQSKLMLQDSPSKSPLCENINLSSPPVQKPRQMKLFASLSHLTTETAPRATIAHVAKITSAVFSNGTSQRLSALNLQQKAVLCALVGAEQKKRQSASASIFATPSKNANSSPTVKQLYESYSTLCKRENLLAPLTSVEFRDVLSGLETLSLVSAVEGKGSSSFAMPITPSKTPSRRGKAAFGGASSIDEKRMASCVGHSELLASLQGPGSDLLKDILEGVE